MSPDQELKKLLEKKAVQLQANYKVLICRYYQTVRIGYHNPEIVAERFDRIVKRYDMEMAEKILTNKILTFGMLRGHIYSKDGWTAGAWGRRRAALEARAELPEIYKKLEQESKELRATLDALEDIELRTVHQTWWRDVKAEAEAGCPESERLEDVQRDQMALEDQIVEPGDRLDELEIVEERIQDEILRRGR